MCGRVCSPSRVKGGVERCEVRHESARWCVGGGACWLPVWARGGRLRFLGAAGAAIGVLWVRACSSPLFLLLLGAPLGCGESKGSGVG